MRLPEAAGLERRARERVGLGTRLAYGSGAISEGVKNTAFNVFLLFYDNVVLGLSGTLGGAAILLALVVDAITDPLVGSWSDNLHSRWGRRHPFMYVSALPMGVAMTLYSIPSNSMVAELTPNYDERTSLVSWRFFFGWAAGITIAQVGDRLFFASKPGFADGRLDAGAHGGFALVCAIAIVRTILLCSLGTRSLIASLEAPPDPTPFPSKRLLGEVREVFGNRC